MRIIAPVGDLWELALTAGAATLVGWVAGNRLFRWSRRRCDEALAAARSLPPPRGRSFVLLATTDDRPLSRAQARELRAVQQALDDERRDGALLARRAVPSVWPAHAVHADGDDGR